MKKKNIFKVEAKNNEIEIKNTTDRNNKSYS